MGELRELCIMSIKQTEAGKDDHSQDYNCEAVIICQMFAMS